MGEEERGWPYEPVDRAPPAPPVTATEPVPQSVRRPEGAGPEPAAVATTRTAPLLALVVVLTVATLLATFAVGDWWTRNRELDVLLTRIATAEQAQQPMQRSFARIARDCALGSGRCDVVALQLAARAALPGLRTSGEAVAETEIIRFHGPLRDLRDRYVEHNVAWQRWLEAMASGSVAIDAPDDIASTFRAAGAAALRAIPPFPRHDGQDRVESIFFS